MKSNRSKMTSVVPSWTGVVSSIIAAITVTTPGLCVEGPANARRVIVLAQITQLAIEGEAKLPDKRHVAGSGAITIGCHKSQRPDAESPSISMMGLHT